MIQNSNSLFFNGSSFPTLHPVSARYVPAHGVSLVSELYP